MATTAANDLGELECAKRVLVIDDDASVRLALAEGLRRRGFEVEVASSGRQALSQVASGEEFQTIVSDVFMEDGDGFEVLRSLGKGAGSPAIVLMSGGSRMMGSVECLQLAKPLGAVGVLQKPFTMDELLNLLEPSKRG